MKRKFLPALIAAASMVWVTNATAAEYRKFSPAAFNAAQSSGKPIVVDVFATWCPTCAAQEPVIKQLSASPKYKDLIIFKLDFDGQKAEQRRLKVTRQSTLIAFRGRRETARSVGATDPIALQRVLDSTAG
jgi:thioredoxin 1